MADVPLVSVYIPTYNRLGLLGRAIESALNQTYKNIEVLVVDDGSSDGTQEFLAELERKERRVRVVEKKGQRGPCSSRNLAIREASGEFVAGLDDDDYFHPDRISLLMSRYDKKMAFITSNHYVISERGNKRSSLLSRRLTKRLLSLRNASGQILAERKKILAVGGYDESLRASQDIDLWLRLVLRFGPAYRVSRCLYFVDVQHGGERISVSDSRRIGTKQFLEKHESIIPKKAAAYKMDCYISTADKEISPIGFVRKYGFGMFVEVVRNKINLG